MGVEVYPEIEYGKVYKVKTLYAYNKNKKRWNSYVKRTVRYVTRWRRDEDIFLMSTTTIPDSAFAPFCLLEIRKSSTYKGTSPLFTDIEERKDLELSTVDDLGDRLVCFGEKNSRYFHPFDLEGVTDPYYNPFMVYGMRVMGVGYYHRSNYNGESKVHFSQSCMNVNEVRILVDDDVYI